MSLGYDGTPFNWRFFDEFGPAGQWLSPSLRSVIKQHSPEAIKQKILKTMSTPNTMEFNGVKYELIKCNNPFFIFHILPPEAPTKQELKGNCLVIGGEFYAYKVINQPSMLGRRIS